MLSRAQEIKRKLSPEPSKGKKHSAPQILAREDIISVAKVVNISVLEGSLEDNSNFSCLECRESHRCQSFEVDCPNCKKPEDRVILPETAKADQSLRSVGGLPHPSTVDIRIESETAEASVVSEIEEVVVGRRGYKKRVK